MAIESLPCCQCGSELQILPGTPYVTCFQCHTYLSIHWEASPAYTEKVEQSKPLTQQTPALADDNHYKNKLDQLLQQWEEERKRYLIRNKNGEYTVPQGESLISPTLGVGLLLAGIASLVLMGAFASPFSLWLLLLPLFLFLLGGSAFVGVDEKRAQAYQEAQRKFQERVESLKRDHLLEKQSSFSTQDIARLRLIQLLKTVVTATPYA